MKERQKKIYIFLDEWIIFNWGVHTVDVYEFVRNARFQRVLFSLLELELRLNVWGNRRIFLFTNGNEISR